MGVVAAASDDLATQMLAADDLADTITTPSGEPPARWEPALPVVAATRRMLEQRAPEWPPFDFDHGRLEPLDLPSVVTGIARTIIAREAARSYRGDKRRVYKELVGREAAFVDLVVRVLAPGARLDLDARDRTHRPGGRMIRRLRIQGWRAFDDVTLELGEGLTFVVADNGVGKTSLVQAASWGLYGGLSQVDSSAARRIGSPLTRVDVEVELPDGRTLTIGREARDRGGDIVWTRLGEQELDDDGLARALAEAFGATREFLAMTTLLPSDAVADDAAGAFHLQTHLRRVFGVDDLQQAAEAVRRLHDRGRDGRPAAAPGEPAGGRGPVPAARRARRGGGRVEAHR